MLHNHGPGQPAAAPATSSSPAARGHWARMRGHAPQPLVAADAFEWGWTRKNCQLPPANGMDRMDLEPGPNGSLGPNGMEGREWEEEGTGGREEGGGRRGDGKGRARGKGEGEEEGEGEGEG